MAKKAAKKAVSKTKKSGARTYTVHHKLEKPVHNLLSYTVLFALALVVLALVLKLQSV